jgi:dihydrofolate synthase/folylpolyglutamate synthase
VTRSSSFTGGAARAANAPSGVLERLYQLAPRGALLGLDRVREACARYGHPERHGEFLHIAGTNGKGSVAAMVSAMGQADGKRVGLYTSPHLCRFHERIQIDNEPAPDEVLESVLGDVLERCPDLTFFETVTVAAFVVFATLDVELAAVEVGLGGRLDATNVLPAPRATAITRIALDHMNQLGPDIASIAREKAGIVKPGVPLIVGPLVAEAWREVEAMADAVKARVIHTDRNAELSSFVAQHPPALGGAHQSENAKIAVALGREAGLSTEAIAAGLRNVKWAGRLESLQTELGEVLLDAAHNPDGAEALAAALRARNLPSQKVALVFGAMADKDHAGMLARLASCAATRVYVAPEGRRAAEPSALAHELSGDVADSLESAMAMARGAAGPDGLVVVAGSIFLVGAARAWLLGLERDPAIAL